MKAIPVPLEKLIPDPTQPRTAMAPADLDALAESINTRGQLLPLRVKPADANGIHIVISGHRRLAALQKLGVATADCVIVDEALDEADTLAEQLAENLLRENLSPIDEAEGYRRFMTLRGITAAQAAGELHVEPARISRALALLDLPDELRGLVHTGRLAKETGYYLSRLPAGDQQQRLFAEAAVGKLSRDKAAWAVKATRSKAVGAESPPVSRVCCKLGGGRSVTVCAAAVRLDTLIDALEEVLKEARKARQQGWDVSTLAKVCRDKAAAGGAA